MRSRQIDWGAVDRLVSGPYRTTGNGPAALFEVPEAATARFRFGQLEPGPAWPAGVPELRRLAALPQPVEALDCRPEDVVLSLREAPGGLRVLCAQSEAGTRWAIDPVLWIEGILGERYVDAWRRPLPSRLPGLNYSLVPHVGKGWLEPLQNPRGGPAANPIGFPQLRLDDLVETLRRLCWTLAAGTPARLASPWPEGRRAAITLTHDVDTPWILDPARRDLLDALLDAECSLGYRGAWYLTAKPLRLARHGAALERIAQRGHEIGSHGWNHDAKLDYVSEHRQSRRMRRAKGRFADRQVSGIRTPWNCRSPGLLDVLSRHFAYDSSVPNASAFYSSRSNSGCCSVFPYRHASGILEIPATLPPDTGLDHSERYRVLGQLVDRIVELGGVVVVTVHPQPHQSGQREGIRSLTTFLEAIHRRHGEALWHATPHEIAQRYESALGTIR